MIEPTEQQANYRTPGRRWTAICMCDEFTLHDCRVVIDVDDRGEVSLRVYGPVRFGEQLIEVYGSQPPEQALRSLADMFARARPIAVTGAQGCGKSLHAAAIARFFDAKTVEPEWDGQRPLPAGCVAFTNAEIESPPPGVVVYSLDRVLESLGLPQGEDSA